MRQRLNHIFKSTIVLGTVVLFSCNNTFEEVAKVNSDELLPYAESFNTEISYTEMGVLNSKLISPHIMRFQQEDSNWTEMPIGLKALFYDSLEQVESEMEAEYGLWLEESATLITKKNVRIKNNVGEKLNTEKLIWYQDSGIFVTDEFVKITQPSGVIYGKGLRAKENFSEYEILEITGNIAVEE